MASIKYNAKEEAREAIKKEFLDRYSEWLRDYAEMPENDYGRKYGWGKGDSGRNDNFESVKTFLRYIWSGHYITGWVEAGYNRQAIWELHREGWLSYQYNSSWMAQHTGRSDFYYLSQKTARQIYTESKR